MHPHLIGYDDIRSRGDDLRREARRRRLAREARQHRRAAELGLPYWR